MQEEDGQTSMPEPNELGLYINEEEKRYSVSWRELCGYFCVTLYFKTKENAKAFFEAAKDVIDYDAD